MLRLPKFVTKTLSIRLSLMVVSAIAVLLLVSLAVMFYFTRLTLKKEALRNAEQTLEGTIQHIDNILLSIEQATGNIYFSMMPHLHQPDQMYTYARQLVEANPYIAGCAIVFEPYYYKDREYFMAYFHRLPNGELAFSDSPIIQAETFGNCPYTEQIWYTNPMEKGVPGWLDPLKNDATEREAITSFCLPIQDSQGKRVGVLAVDLSIDLLSQIVLAAKPSVNGYSTLLGKNGSFIIHPDTTKLQHQTVFTQTEQAGIDPSVKEAADAMVGGETGYKKFRRDGQNYYVFYKPFERNVVPGRTMEKLGWSVGVIYPENDIFGEYNLLLNYVVTIALIGLALLFMLCRIITHRQLLPLRMLTRATQRIAEGNYDETIPDSHRQDEIGRLQDNFQQMQQSLASHVNELEQLKTTLNRHGKELENAYHQAKEAERMKTAFLHNMTNQMVSPADKIVQDVNTICNPGNKMSQEEANQLANDLQSQGKTIVELLRNLLDIADKGKGKEEAYD